MRLRTLTLFTVMLLAAALWPWHAMAQTTTSGKTNKSATCTCGGATKRGLGNTAKKSGHKRRASGNRSAKKPGTIPPVIRYVYPPTPKEEKKITASSADFADMTVDGGQEGTETGKIELSDQTTPSNLGQYLDAKGSDGFTAWFKGNALHVYSAKGGEGRIVISDKSGNMLDVVNVTGKPTSVAATTTDNNITALLSTTNGIWWIAALIALLLFIHLLLSFFQRRGLRNLLIERFNGLHEMIVNGFNNLTDIVHNIDINLVNAGNAMVSHHGVVMRRRANVIYDVHYPAPSDDQPRGTDPEL